ncbi:MAG: DUF4403 family protein [Nitrospiraceae bacterium]|nr:DUF4403 family protein [Nitrospiraceae bacterium]
MRLWTQSIALLPCLFVAVACSHTLPQYTASSIPLSQYTAPAPGAIEVPVSQLPDSTLPVTLVIDLTSLERTLQTTMPERFNEANHPLGKDYRWNFVREGEPHVSIEDGWVTIHATYKGDIEAKTAARGCRLDPVYPVLDTTGQLELGQEGHVFVLSLKTPQMAIDLKPESESKCNMFNSPVKDQLAELLNRGTLVQTIKRAVDEGGFQIPLQQVWTRLQAPVAVNVATFNTQACIYGKPAEMAIGTLKGTVQRTTIPIVVKETPTASFENSCGKPSDSTMKVTSGAALLEGQPYKVLASVTVPYPVVNQGLQEKLFHQPMKVGGDDMVIEQATASDSSGRVLITIRTAGDLNGTIYYWGTPRLEGVGSILTFPDLQMASESKTMLDTIKVGYWQLVDQSLRDKLQRAARVDLSDRIAKMQSAITGTHTSGEVTTAMTMVHQQPQRAYSTPGALVADILFEGTASVTTPVAMETRPPAEQTPGQTLSFSQPSTQK